MQVRAERGGPGRRLPRLLPQQNDHVLRGEFGPRFFFSVTIHPGIFEPTLLVSIISRILRLIPDHKMTAPPLTSGSGSTNTTLTRVRKNFVRVRLSVSHMFGGRDSVVNALCDRLSACTRAATPCPSSRSDRRWCMHGQIGGGACTAR